MFDLAMKYCFYLDKNERKNRELFLLLFTLEKYINGAIIEMNRLEKTRKSIKRLLSISKDEKYRNSIKKSFQLNYLHCDTHFFFICIDKCYKLIDQLSLELNDKDVKKLKIRLNKIFNVVTVRNHLEHIEDRCKGYLSLKDKRIKKQRHIQDFGNFIGNDFSFNGKKFPSDRRSLEELKKIYQDLIKILHSKYASKDPNFIERMKREKEIKLIQKIQKKIESIWSN